MRECFKIGVMGCLPSRRRDNEESQVSSSDTNSTSPLGKAGSQRRSHIHAQGVKLQDKSTMVPTIQMVNADTLKLLKEIGELKVFQTASNVDHEKHIDLHQHIILDLENPTKASCPVTSLPGALSSNAKWIRLWKLSGRRQKKKIVSWRWKQKVIQSSGESRLTFIQRVLWAVKRRMDREISSYRRFLVLKVVQMRFLWVLKLMEQSD